MILLQRALAALSGAPLRLLHLIRPHRGAKVTQGGFLERRAYLVQKTFFAVFLLLGVRAVIIHLFPPAPTSLKTIAHRQYTTKINISSYRGTIYDHRGEALAISIRLPSLYVNPREFAPNPKQLSELARLLEIKPVVLKKLMQKRSYFAWLKRKLEPGTASKIKLLAVPGLYEITEPARFYPSESAAAHMLGYVNIDDKGVMGIERQFEKMLRGPTITLQSQRDARDRVIFENASEAAPEKPGYSLHLTIDHALQGIVEQELEKGVQNSKALGGFAIVSDPHTGRILALANYPTFNPNHRQIKVQSTRNQALMDTFEPGSVMKTFVIGEALEKGKTTLSSTYDCEGGVFHAGGVAFHDSHKPEKQYLTALETFVTSSNVCTYKIAEKLGAQGLYDTYKKYGFGTKQTALAYPGQGFGFISDWRAWRPIRFANLAFGQGMTSTALELVQAFGAVANGGRLLKPFFVHKVENQDGEVVQTFKPEHITQVMRPETAAAVRHMLSEVVEKGATKARSAVFTSGGKTGTSQKVDPVTKRYSKVAHRAIFTGIAPVNQPHLVVMVMIDEPGIAPHYAALWAAPVFKEITEKALRYLNVAPDRVADPKSVAAGDHGAKQNAKRF